MNEVDECSYPECGRKVRAVGLCASHYRLRQEGKPLRPIKDYKIYARPAPDKKICTTCDRVLRVPEDFYTRQSGGPTTACKDCTDLYVRKWKVRNRKAGGEDHAEEGSNVLHHEEG